MLSTGSMRHRQVGSVVLQATPIAYGTRSVMSRPSTVKHVERALRFGHAQVGEQPVE